MLQDRLPAFSGQSRSIEAEWERWCFFSLRVSLKWILSPKKTIYQLFEVEFETLSSTRLALSKSLQVVPIRWSLTVNTPHLKPPLQSFGTTLWGRDPQCFHQTNQFKNPFKRPNPKTHQNPLKVKPTPFSPIFLFLWNERWAKMLRNESSAWRALASPPKPPLQMRGGAHKRVAMKWDWLRGPGFDLLVMMMMMMKNAIPGWMFYPIYYCFEMLITLGEGKNEWMNEWMKWNEWIAPVCMEAWCLGEQTRDQNHTQGVVKLGDGTTCHWWLYSALWLRYQMLCADPRSELRKRRFASTSGEAVESAATEVAEGGNMGGLIGNDYCNGWRCC